VMGDAPWLLPKTQRLAGQGRCFLDDDWVDLQVLIVYLVSVPALRVRSARVPPL